MFLKKYIFILLGMLLFSTAKAQVTIGSGLKASSGALLDLKENDELGVNSTKGLLLPRVALEKKNELRPIISGIATESEKEAHVGLVLYNMSTIEQEDLCPGIYVWNSWGEWSRLYGTCKSVSDLVVSRTTIATDVDGFDKLSPNSGIVEFTYTSSIPVEVTNTDTWFTVNHNSAFKSIKIDAAPNNDASRNATITLSDGITTQLVTMTQDALSFAVAANPSSVAPSGGTSTIFITKNSTRREVMTVSHSAWATLANSNTSNPSVSVQNNTSGSRRVATFLTALTPLNASSGKANLGTTAYQQSTISQDELPPVVIPYNGIWSYKDNSTGGAWVLSDKYSVFKSPGNYTNVQIKCVELREASHFPLKYLKVDVSGGATYTGLQIHKDPIIGDYVTFTSVKGPKSSGITVHFLGNNNKVSYMFGYLFN